MELTGLFSKLFMLFATIGAAYIAAKAGVFGRETNKSLAKIINFIFNPATMIASAVTSERLLSNRQVLALTGIAFACYAFLIASSFLIPILLRVPRESAKLYRFMYIFSNIGFFGLPVVRALFGESAAFLVVIFILPFQLLTFTYGVTLVSHDKENQHLSPKMLSHPMIIACAVSYILYLTKAQIPTFLTDTVSFMGGATSPCAMLVVGGALAFVPLKKVFLNIRLYGLVLIKMVLIPLLVLTVLRRIVPASETNNLIIAVSTVVMSMPIAANTTILAAQYNGDTETAACGVFLATIFSAVSIPFLMWLLAR